MTSKFFAGAAAISLAFATPALALPTTSAYSTDPQSEYVQDDTSDSIASLNMVLCIVGSMGAGSMVNAGPYVALVDMNKCDNKQASAAGAGATNYATAVLDVTRASNSDPMIGKVWLSMAEDGNSVDVFVHLSATQSPSAALPYGLFRLDYLGKKNGVTAFNGFVDSQPTSISQFETGPNSSNTAMALSATSTSVGAGTITSMGGPSFDFAYDANFFRRSDGTHDECFDRSKAHAQRSVWQYGTYNANDGSRVDMAHPGFPIVASYAGTMYYGFANYWGINFQGLDLNSVADAEPISGLTVTDQRPGNTTSYTLSKVGGKLTKWTQQSTTLDSLNNIPLTVGADLTGRTEQQRRQRLSELAAAVEFCDPDLQCYRYAAMQPERVRDDPDLADRDRQCQRLQQRTDCGLGRFLRRQYQYPPDRCSPHDGGQCLLLCAVECGARLRPVDPLLPQPVSDRSLSDCIPGGKRADLALRQRHRSTMV